MNNNKVNVQSIVKKILGLENISDKNLTKEDKKKIWNVQACFRRTSYNGRVGKRYAYHSGKGMDLIAKYFESK